MSRHLICPHALLVALMSRIRRNTSETCCSFHAALLTIFPLRDPDIVLTSSKQQETDQKRIQKHTINLFSGKHRSRQRVDIQKLSTTGQKRNRWHQGRNVSEQMPRHTQQHYPKQNQANLSILTSAENVRKVFGQSTSPERLTKCRELLVMNQWKPKDAPRSKQREAECAPQTDTHGTCSTE